jgi:hypothetical protein
MTRAPHLMHRHRVGAMTRAPHTMHWHRGGGVGAATQAPQAVMGTARGAGPC